jgi:hypothetical protein
MIEHVADKDLRDHLEALQVELRTLEARERATRERLEQATARASAAVAREREASLARPPRRDGVAWRPLGRSVLRWGVITLLVIAAFGAMIGTVTFAIHRYTQIAMRWSAPE